MEKQPKYLRATHVKQQIQHYNTPNRLPNTQIQESSDLERKCHTSKTQFPNNTTPTSRRYRTNNPNPYNG